MLHSLRVSWHLQLDGERLNALGQCEVLLHGFARGAQKAGGPWPSAQRRQPLLPQPQALNGLRSRPLRMKFCKAPLQHVLHLRRYHREPYTPAVRVLAVQLLLQKCQAHKVSP